MEYNEEYRLWVAAERERRRLGQQPTPMPQQKDRPPVPEPVTAKEFPLSSMVFPVTRDSGAGG